MLHDSMCSSRVSETDTTCTLVPKPSHLQFLVTYSIQNHFVYTVSNQKPKVGKGD